MPQLNPSPWFAILFFCWLVLLFIVVPKVLAHTLTNDPAMQSIALCDAEPWFWPWA